MDVKKIDRVIKQIIATGEITLDVYTLDKNNAIVSDSEIKKIESDIGFNLCQDYKTYVKVWGHINIVDLSLLGIIYHDGEVVDLFSDHTHEFYEKYFDTLVKGFTVFGITEDEEWFLILDHSSSMVTPYDPFAKKYIKNMAKPFDQFLYDQLLETLEICEE